MRAFLACLLIVSALLWGAPAWGASNTQQAKQLFQQGTAAFDRGAYADALDAFERGHRLKPLPGFLYNIAQCHRRLGNHQEAISFYERYLLEVPQASNRAEVEVLLAEERASLVAKQEAESKARADAATAPNPPSIEQPAPAAAVPSASIPADDPGDQSPLLLAAVVGGGALLLATGAVIMVAALPAPSAASLGRVDLRGARP